MRHEDSSPREFTSSTTFPRAHLCASVLLPSSCSQSQEELHPHQRTRGGGGRFIVMQTVTPKVTFLPSRETVLHSRDPDPELAPCPLPLRP